MTAHHQHHGSAASLSRERGLSRLWMHMHSNAAGARLLTLPNLLRPKEVDTGTLSFAYAHFVHQDGKCGFGCMHKSKTRPHVDPAPE